jgi:hypothetical protein
MVIRIQNNEEENLLNINNNKNNNKNMSMKSTMIY